MTVPTFASELILGNGVAVTAGTLYVVDGVVKLSPITGTVSTLKAALSATTIKNCSIGARRAFGADLDRIIG